MKKPKYLTVSELSKKIPTILNELAGEEGQQFIILKNRAPIAIMMSMNAYEAMQEEIEDLHLIVIAMARSQTFDINKAISHENMKRIFRL